MAIKERADEVATKAKRRFGIENPSAADADGNVGTVRGALRAFGQGEFDQFMDALQEDVTWEAPGGDFPGGNEIEGREALKDKFIADIGRTYTEFGFVPENFVDTDDGAVIVVGRFTGDPADGGDTLDAPGVQIWQFGRSSEAELIRIYTDGSAFPELITEQKEKEREEEEKKREEEEKQKAEEQKAEGEGSDDSDDSDSDDSDSDDQPKAEKKDESKAEDKDESKKDDDEG
jgi:ketosteroid isomerase-like protein